MPETALATPTVEQLAEQLAALKTERDEYKRLYVSLMEAFRKLEAGLVRHNRERFISGEEQTTLSLLGMLTGEADVAQPVAAATTQVEAHERVKPTGRKPLPDKLPRIHVEVLPPEVQRAGLDAFHRIGEDVTETVEHRRASLVVVRTVRPKYVAKDKLDAMEKEGDSTPVLQASAPELPIPRALAGPGLLADTIVRRWQDHLPLHRLERVYGREGLPLARSTMCGWHAAVAELATPLVVAMFRDAQENSSYLCLDATGVLVQALEKCRRGHFFVLVSSSGTHRNTTARPSTSCLATTAGSSSPTRTPSTSTSTERASPPRWRAGRTRDGTCLRLWTRTGPGPATPWLSCRPSSRTSANGNSRRPRRSCGCGRGSPSQ